jgi:hypothetical protein
MHDPHALLFDIPNLLSVWHVEPGKNDAGRICKWHRMKWHVWHWHVKIMVWQRLRRRWLTKCAWCDGGSSSESPVNTCGWDKPDVPWWMGERGMYHAECMMARDAHATCTCILPVVDLGGHVCVNCGLVVRLVDTHHMRTMRTLKAMPYGVRPSLPVAEPR